MKAFKKSLLLAILASTLTTKTFAMDEEGHRCCCKFRSNQAYLNYVNSTGDREMPEFSTPLRCSFHENLKREKYLLKPEKPYKDLLPRSSQWEGGTDNKSKGLKNLLSTIPLEKIELTSDSYLNPSDLTLDSYLKSKGLENLLSPSPPIPLEKIELTLDFSLKPSEDKSSLELQGNSSKENEKTE